MYCQRRPWSIDHLFRWWPAMQQYPCKAHCLRHTAERVEMFGLWWFDRSLPCRWYLPTKIPCRIARLVDQIRYSKYQPRPYQVQIAARVSNERDHSLLNRWWKHLRREKTSMFILNPTHLEKISCCWGRSTDHHWYQRLGQTGSSPERFDCIRRSRLPLNNSSAPMVQCDTCFENCPSRQTKANQLHYCEL